MLRQSVKDRQMLAFELVAHPDDHRKILRSGVKISVPRPQLHAGQQQCHQTCAFGAQESVVFAQVLAHTRVVDRRTFLSLLAGSVAIRLRGDDPPALLGGISQQILWDNRKGEGTTWFHPRACMVSATDGSSSFTLMTLQEISGSDYYGPVHWSESHDGGRKWSRPQPVPSLGQEPVTDHPGLRQGVCDVVPESHPQTKTVLALGHRVFYRGPKFSSKDQLQRAPVYSVRDKAGNWSPGRSLAWNDPRGAYIYTNNCGQRVVTRDGEIILAFSFGPTAERRMVAGVRCSFDGRELRVIEVGPPLTNPVGRGLLEPSVTRFDDRYFLTLRAEDERGYVSTGRDGVHYTDKKPWTWEDGTPLILSTTQQHWLTHSNGLFLVYTRRTDTNRNVIRWRAPLFVAQVDTDRLCLLRDTERVAVPLEGDGIDGPDGVPLMGNFHVTNASRKESWVTVGDWLPRRGIRGRVHLARLDWNRPNHLAAPATNG